MPREYRKYVIAATTSGSRMWKSVRKKVEWVLRMPFIILIGMLKYF
jgi:hypothetical protein